MPKASPRWIVTANFTADGAVGYFTAARSFSRQLADVVVFDTKDDAEAALAEARRQEAAVCDPYLFEVAEAGAGLDLLSARERIRSQGPTVAYGRFQPKSSAV